MDAHRHGGTGRRSLHLPRAGVYPQKADQIVAIHADGPRSAPLFSHRKSPRQDILHRRSSSGHTGTSHYSRPIPIPAGRGDVRIEVVSGKSDREASYPLPQDDPRTPTQRSGVERNVKFKKQITKIAKPLVAPVTNRRRKKFKDGEVVFKGHRNWEIVLSIQFGLRHTSSLLADSQPQNLSLKALDFDERLIFDFNPVTEHRSAVKSHAKWEHPAPYVYRVIRDKFNVKEEKFLESVCLESRIREVPTPGKSGALFYITEDETFLMKTVTTHEDRRLKAILPDYYRHVCDNPQTMLTRFLSHFSVRTTNGRHIRMVVMASIFSDFLFIDRRYDLKGSTKNRKATSKEISSDNVTYKDLDLESPIFFSPSTVERIMTQLDRDAAFLERNNVMDYSLLLGLNLMIPEEIEMYREHDALDDWERPYFIGHQQDSRDGIKKCYRICMGIIDTLQGFSLRKKLEHCGKTVQFCSGSVMSVVPPSKYRRRFVDFLKTKFLPDPNLSLQNVMKDVTLLPNGVSAPSESDDE